MKSEEYGKKVEQSIPRSPIVKNCIAAFLVGGTVCLAGEGLFVSFSFFHLNEKEASAWVCISLIALTGFLTGIGVFDSIAKFAGAGTMVPITGFANSVVSPAVEYQTEGRISGTAVKMFSIAGPVIVFGCSAATLYGIIYYFFLR